MMKHSGVAIGAGLASALLFVVSAKGTAAATLILLLTALPIMIAALGYGHLSGAAGALIGSAAVSVAIGPILGAFYALSFALPGWWLSYLALLARPAASVAQATPGASGSPAMTWYPVGRIVTWAAAIASGAVLLWGVVVLLRFGGYDQAVVALSRRLAQALGPSGPDTTLDRASLADILVRFAPPAVATLLFLMLIVNLWLGGRVSEMSQRLVRPWASVPDGLRLPKQAAAVAIACFGLCLVPGISDGALGAALATIAAALGMAFALQGLATGHVLTRGFTGRGAILALIYILTAMIPLALIALTLLGMIDCLFTLRSRRSPPPPPNKPIGETPWK